MVHFIPAVNKLFLKGQEVNSEGLADHGATVTATELCSCRVKAVIGNTQKYTLINAFMNGEFHTIFKC